jgi:hypothetical protein
VVDLAGYLIFWSILLRCVILSNGLLRGVYLLVMLISMLNNLEVLPVLVVGATTLPALWS